MQNVQGGFKIPSGTWGSQPSKGPRGHNPKHWDCTKHSLALPTLSPSHGLQDPQGNSAPAVGRGEKRGFAPWSLFYSEMKQNCFDFTLISLKLKDLEAAKQGLHQNIFKFFSIS